MEMSHNTAMQGCRKVLQSLQRYAEAQEAENAPKPTDKEVAENIFSALMEFEGTKEEKTPSPEKLQRKFKREEKKRLKREEK